MVANLNVNNSHEKIQINCISESVNTPSSKPFDFWKSIFFETVHKDKILRANLKEEYSHIQII